jgi:hypothetical protein
VVVKYHSLHDRVVPRRFRSWLAPAAQGEAQLGPSEVAQRYVSLKPRERIRLQIA